MINSIDTIMTIMIISVLFSPKNNAPKLFYYSFKFMFIILFICVHFMYINGHDILSYLFLLFITYIPLLLYTKFDISEDYCRLSILLTALYGLLILINIIIYFINLCIEGDF